MSWNVNGIRTLQSSSHSSIEPVLKNFEADIICFQETKISRTELIRFADSIALVDAFVAFFASPKAKKGYSGVATFCKNPNWIPFAAEDSILSPLPLENINSDDLASRLANQVEVNVQRLKELDAEGRCLISDHGAFILLNVYFPNLGSKDRASFKNQFNLLIQKRCEMLLNTGKEVIVVGDLNISLRPIDHCDPRKSVLDLIEWANEVPAAFCKSDRDKLISKKKDVSQVRLSNPKFDILIPELFALSPWRQWLHSWLVDGGGVFVDIFRENHPKREGAFTCWNTRINAREGNYGTRIDYILTTPGLANRIINVDIMPEVKGSDHCPIFANISIELDERKCRSQEVPSLAVQNMPELKGKQQKIHSFFVKKSSLESSGYTSVSMYHEKSMSSSCDVNLPVREISKPKRSKVDTIPGGLLNFGFSKTSKQSETHHKSSGEEDRSGVIIDEDSKTVKSSKAESRWEEIFSNAFVVPKCLHGEPAIQKTVSKKGVNFGRTFYICKYPEMRHQALSSNSSVKSESTSCKFFKWANFPKTRISPSSNGNHQAPS